VPKVGQPASRRRTFSGDKARLRNAVLVLVTQTLDLEIQLSQPLVDAVRNLGVRISADRRERDQFSQVFIGLHDLSTTKKQDV
jgi:hypothetical protein